MLDNALEHLGSQALSSPLQSNYNYKNPKLVIKSWIDYTLMYMLAWNLSLLELWRPIFVKYIVVAMSIFLFVILD